MVDGKNYEQLWLITNKYLKQAGPILLFSCIEIVDTKSQQKFSKSDTLVQPLKIIVCLYFLSMISKFVKLG